MADLNRAGNEGASARSAAPAVDDYVVPPEPAPRRPSPLWGIAVGLVLLICFSLITEMARRFLGTQPDSLSVTGVVLQVALAVGAGTTLTRVGDAQLERLLGRIGINPGRVHLWKLALAVAVLGVIVGVRLLLPALASWYNNRGFDLQQRGNLLDAIEHYERAVRLKPDYAEAHYNLAAAHEDALEYDKAIAEYQLALRANPSFYSPYNNLARLYLLRKSEYGNALEILDAALRRLAAEGTRAPDSARRAYFEQTRYSLLKNHGWANLGLGNLEQAQDDLRDALTVRPNGAAAHCLLAQVIEAKAKAAPAAVHPDARAEWEACLRNEDSREKDDIVEAAWLALANERLHPRNATP